jgi:hypothetical protein
MSATTLRTGAPTIPLGQRLAARGIDGLTILVVQNTVMLGLDPSIHAARRAQARRTNRPSAGRLPATQPAQAGKA